MRLMVPCESCDDLKDLVGPCDCAMTGNVQLCNDLKDLDGPCNHAMTGTVHIVR